LTVFADIEIEIDCLHFLLWRSKKEFNIALYMHALIAPLSSLQRVEVW